MATLNMTTQFFTLRLCCAHQHFVKYAMFSTGTSKADIGNTSYGENKHKKQIDLLSSYKAKLMSTRIPRVEKIEVNFLHMGIGDGATMLMNKGLSTPYNCAQHISKIIVRDSVLALVKRSTDASHGQIIVEETNSPGSDNQEHNSKMSDKALDSAWVPWDMHRPLEYDCDLKLLKFDMELATPEETALVNKAYWNTCAVVLGAVVQQAFKDNAMVKLVHLPEIDIESGAFCYDVELLQDKEIKNKNHWYNDDSSLVELTKVARHIISQNNNFERIELPKHEAEIIFSNHGYMRERLTRSYSTVTSNSSVPIYRFGNFLDIVDGPLLPSTSFMFHYVVTAVHRLGSKDNESCLWRFQGLSLPKQLQVHHAIWAMLEHRAKRLVNKDLPFDIFYPEDVDVPFYKYRSIENRTKKYNIATGQWLNNEWAISPDISS